MKAKWAAPANLSLAEATISVSLVDGLALRIRELIIYAHSTRLVCERDHKYWASAAVLRLVHAMKAMGQLCIASTQQLYLVLSREKLHLPSCYAATGPPGSRHQQTQHAKPEVVT